MIKNRKPIKQSIKKIRKSWMISPQQNDQLIDIVQKTNLSESEHVRRALDGYMFKKRREMDYQ